MPQCLAPETFLVITAPCGLTLGAAFRVWQRGGSLWSVVGWGSQSWWRVCGGEDGNILIDGRLGIFAQSVP